ncbi:hypothetical protein MSAN_01561500 [Mycena sanguinolenta]|uniref:Uncharacterized protein n=1 Tax=Mycena sanguinolenta TaxID=230812 RepID=A0A8H6XZN9_9AGAR|nr:hypothetical protein MSAN_01561500 [Mycena sanguinolenta]
MPTSSLYRTPVTPMVLGTGPAQTEIPQKSNGVYVPGLAQRKRESRAHTIAKGLERAGVGLAGGRQSKIAGRRPSQEAEKEKNLTRALRIPASDLGTKMWLTVANGTVTVFSATSESRRSSALSSRRPG